MLTEVNWCRINIIYCAKRLHSTYIIQPKNRISMFMGQNNLQVYNFISTAPSPTTVFFLNSKKNKFCFITHNQANRFFFKKKRKKQEEIITFFNKQPLATYIRLMQYHTKKLLIIVEVCSSELVIYKAKTQLECQILTAECI